MTEKIRDSAGQVIGYIGGPAPLTPYPTTAELVVDLGRQEPRIRCGCCGASSWVVNVAQLEARCIACGGLMRLAPPSQESDPEAIAPPGATSSAQLSGTPGAGPEEAA